MLTALRGPLFGSVDSVDAVRLRSLDPVQRTNLSDGAWIDVLPAWLTGADTLFDRLVTGVPWHAERRQMYDRVVDVPRLLSFHDLSVEDPPHPLLARLRRRLNDIYAG